MSARSCRPCVPAHRLRRWRISLAAVSRTICRRVLPEGLGISLDLNVIPVPPRLPLARRRRAGGGSGNAAYLQLRDRHGHRCCAEKRPTMSQPPCRRVARNRFASARSSPSHPVPAYLRTGGWRCEPQARRDFHFRSRVKYAFSGRGSQSPRLSGRDRACLLQSAEAEGLASRKRKELRPLPSIIKSMRGVTSSRSRCRSFSICTGSN